MDRRRFLKAGILAGGAGAVLPSAALVSPVAARRRDVAVPGESPYGPLSETPDENGLLLPAGFTSRVIAVGGDAVGDTDCIWHVFPDGAATFDDGEGGWYYVCNSEVFDFLAPDSGGVSAIHFASDGSIIDAYRILEGSNSNCAGGPTPWGTWLSGEENIAGFGRMWECDPTGAKPAVAHEAMGIWSHEAAAVDPVDEVVYLTEDNPEGLVYRYTPTAYPDLSAGTLEACIVADDGSVTWGAVSDPSAAMTPTRQQVAGAKIFPGNEGIWYFDGSIYFTTKYDHSVHEIDLRNQKYSLVWKGDPDGLGVEGAVLSGVDNITVDEGSGDLVVAEDGANMELVIITPDGAVAPFVRVVAAGHESSEMTGPVFNPSRDRLYFSSQRGPSNKNVEETVPGLTGLTGPQGGITYEITGPFRGRVVEAPPTTEAPVATEAPTSEAPAGVTPPSTALGNVPTGSGNTNDDAEDGGGSGAAIGIGIGVAAAAAVVGGAVAFRKRRMDKAE